MTDFSPNWLPFALGTMPHTDAAAAWKVITSLFAEIPFWPQLPRRSYLETMYVQFSERFPGVRFDKGRIHVDRQRDLNADLERLYLAYLEDDLDYGHIGADHAEGLTRLRDAAVSLPEARLAIKGQAIGPISLGLTVVDGNQRPIIYDQVLADAVGKHLRLKVAWQERELRRHASRTLIVLEEPYMASFGSAFVSLPREQVIGLLEEVFDGLQGITGVHCCGNTDWSILLDTSADVVSLDAYDYGDTLGRYPEHLSRYLKRGGIVAWGIVPAGLAAETESVNSLSDRLCEVIERLATRGVDRAALYRVGLVSPSCGLGAVTPALAESICALTVDVAREMRERAKEYREPVQNEETG
jgi:hypothetical protein